VILADFSGELFSYQGESPDFLPSRLRLPDGQTRYVHSITLEEILSCGYKGPLVVPSCCDNESVYWCCETHAFLVKQKSISDTEASIDFHVREALKVILSNRNPSDRDTLTQSGQAKYDFYYGVVLSLLNSTKLLTQEDEPKLELEAVDYIGSKEKYIADNNWLEKMKYEYEVNGMIFAPDDRECILSDYYSNFVIPSSWVPSGTLS
jgi:hypothetical protein